MLKRIYAHNNYNVITLIESHHFDTNLKGSANMRVYTVSIICCTLRFIVLNLPLLTRSSPVKAICEDSVI